MSVAQKKEKMEQIGNEIMNGHIRVNPYKMGEQTGCDYCAYKGICGFDDKMPGYQYREIENYKDEEALAKIKQAMSE